MGFGGRIFPRAELLRGAPLCAQGNPFEFLQLLAGLTKRW